MSAGLPDKLSLGLAIDLLIRAALRILCYKVFSVLSAHSHIVPNTLWSKLKQQPAVAAWGCHMTMWLKRLAIAMNPYEALLPPLQRRLGKQNHYVAPAVARCMWCHLLRSWTDVCRHAHHGAMVYVSTQVYLALYVELSLVVCPCICEWPQM